MAYNMRITVVSRPQPHAAAARASVVSASRATEATPPLPARPVHPSVAMRPRAAIVPRRPIVVRQRYTPPPVDGLPNDSVVVVPRGLARRPVPSIIANPPTSAMGIIPPNRPIVVPRSPRRKKLNGLVAILPGDAFEMVSPTTIGPIVVPVPPRRTTAVPSVVLRTSYDTTRQQAPHFAVPIVVRAVAPRRVALTIAAKATYDSIRQQAPHQNRPVVVPTSRRRKRLFGLALVLPGDAFEMMPPMVMRPIIVPAWPSKASGHRPPTLVVAKSSENPRAIPAFRPVVVPAWEKPRLAAWTISSLYRKFVEPPAEHFPTPRTLVVRQPRRFPALPLRPIVSKSAYQFPGNMVDKPWDLIAACIAHLRTDAAIVSMFGDVAASDNRRKFVSDVELPKTDPPYAVFDEPWEVEGYETPDQDGRVASVAHGRFEINVYATEKLAARQLAERLASSLTDADLQFVDGVLLYLRREDREWRTFTSPGNRGNVTLYRRTIGFQYIIDRYF